MKLYEFLNFMEIAVDTLKKYDPDLDIHPGGPNKIEVIDKGNSVIIEILLEDKDEC